MGPNPDRMDPDSKNPKPVNEILENRKPDRDVGTSFGSIPGMVPGKMGLESETSKWVGWNQIKLV